MRGAKQVASTTRTMVQETPRLPEGALLKGKGGQSRATRFTETRQYK